MPLMKAGIPQERDVSEKVWFDPKDINELMRLHPPDSSDGWRVVAKYPAHSCADPRYRAAHARSQRIRSGKVGYLSELGQWNARAVKKAHEVWLYLRFEGSDGGRW